MRLNSSEQAPDKSVISSDYSECCADQQISTTEALNKKRKGKKFGTGFQFVHKKIRKHLGQRDASSDLLSPKIYDVELLNNSLAASLSPPSYF